MTLLRQPAGSPAGQPSRCRRSRQTPSLMSPTRPSPDRSDHSMDHRQAAGTDALPLLPEVHVPSPRVAPREVLHRNPFETVYAVHADFGAFAKDYYVVDFGPRAAVVAVQAGKVL